MKPLLTEQFINARLLITFFRCQDSKELTMLLLKSLFIVDLLLCCSISAMSIEMNREMEVIEKHLIENVDSEDLELNFKSISVWLKSDDSSISPEQKSTVESFMELYLATNTDQICSKATYELLQSNRKAADIADDWNVDMLHQFSKCCRVRILLRKVVEKIADVCLSALVEQFKRRIKMIDSGKLTALRSNFRLLDDHFHELFKQRPGGGIVRSFAQFKLQQYLGYDINMGSSDHFLKFIEKYTQLSARGQSLIEKRIEVSAKIDHFLREFFINPCGFYLEQMSDLAEPLVAYIRLKKRELDMISEEDLYLLVGEYYMCRKITGDIKSIVDKLVDCKVGNRLWFGVICQ